MSQPQTLFDLLLTFEQRGGQTAIIERTGVRRFKRSYRDLFERTGQMAHFLAEQGVNKGDRVVVWAPNSFWWAVTYWACASRGAVIVPVDFGSGLERAAKIAELTEAKVIVQSQFKADRFDDSRAVLAEELKYLLDGRPVLCDDPGTAPEDLAEIMYTSGTTSDPKGVMLSHQNLTANLIQVTGHITIGSNYRFLSLLPLSHMFEQLAGFLVPLYLGCQIVYLGTLKPTAIMEAFAEEDIYVTVIVPRLLQVLKEKIENTLAEKHLLGGFAALKSWAAEKSLGIRRTLFYPIRKKFGSNFQFFVSGGSALDGAVFSFWQGIGIPVIEGYGLTETSPVATANTRERQVLRSVGVPPKGVTVRLAEDREILISGANVFMGYYKNPHATLDAFTDQREFRSGDLGRFDEEGNLYIDGRKKEMIVLPSGMNVFPDDIEGVLNALPGVQQSCIVGKKTTDGEEVHAVLILNGSRDPKDIIREANSKLESTQQITGFTIWPEAKFPTTSTLKIQRTKVRDQIAKGTGDGQVSMVGDELQQLLAEVTKRNPGEITDAASLVNDLGLTSIGRLQLVTYLEQKFRLDVEEDAITPQTVVGDLRRMIEKREQVQSANTLRFWTNSAPTRALRRVTDLLLWLCFYRWFLQLKVEGMENLDRVDYPVIFISNHVSYLDQPAIYFALPRHIRARLATAAWAEFFTNGNSILVHLWKRVAYELVTILLNVFPLPQTKGFRKSLQFMGRLIDNKINFLIFPEGERSADAELLPFMPGLGLMVSQLQVPVVPIKITGIENVLQKGSSRLRRGTVTVRFGKPLQFGFVPPSEIVETARETVATL